MHGCRGPWKSGSPDFRRKGRFSVPFRVLSCLALVIFPKSDLLGMISVNLRQHHGSDVKIMESSSNASKSPTGHKESTLSARPIVKLTGQMLPPHWCQSMSEVVSPSYIKQHVDPSAIIAKRIPKDMARPATLQAT